ncbi:hypothetical protein Athai_39650 [Actinocatenispora thailandica]|uniref:Uncharacterized protein n=1 Tax=Actinocatenispora thailandica TaxID=227318 RepID=A0A7R7DRJ3_9ACTN|nr:hypothetical protein [Actinocatenispora thailandica]BCJ36462.1 hypothetical protein Athai_39650 [Actinocatenispora thailandica]
MRLNAATAEFDRFLAVASVYWSNNIRPVGPGAGTIVVEVLHQDLRVALRTLTVANGLRRIFPARLIVLTGSDPDWHDALWTRFDTGLVRKLADAYQADDVLDVHELVDAYLATGAAAGPGRPAGGDDAVGWVGAAPAFRVAGRGVPTRTGREPLDAAELAANRYATACRLLKVPRLTDEHRGGEKYRRIVARTDAFADAYDRLFAAFTPDALVTSHVDYNQWGLAVSAARRYGTPILHVQTTGSLKSYAVYPEDFDTAPSPRAALTGRIGEYFEKTLWPMRESLRHGAELVSWRAKGNLGRPSWWRGGATASVDIRTGTERRQLRSHAAHRFGFEPDRPTVAVFNHAVSDALGTNVEHFADLADWFERTADYAAERTDVNWLFVDHPSQGLYDATGFFDAVADRHAGRGNLAFVPSAKLAKNLLLSLTDLGVTVRGSVSNELPAYGIPAVMAGWAEWSACGFARVATGVDDYWSVLDDSIGGLRSGAELVSPEQQERARLWHWFYRTAADVPTSLVPHWEAGQSDQLLRILRVAMQHVESDGDPAFTAVRRMWRRREPFLTRFDLSAAEDELWEG